MNIEITPEVWGKVQGSMRVGDAIYALVDIDGSLLNVSLPMTISQNSGSWPLSAGSVIYMYTYIICTFIYIYMCPLLMFCQHVYLHVLVYVFAYVCTSHVYMPIYIH